MDQRDGEGKTTLIHPSHQHRSTRVKNAHGSEVTGSKEWGIRRQRVKPDHGKCDWRGDPRGIPELHELPAEAEPKWQRETLAATGRMSGELVGSFQELLEDPSNLQQALLSQAVPSVEG